MTQHLIDIHGDICTFGKKSWHQDIRCGRLPLVQLCSIYLYNDRTGVCVTGLQYFAPKITVLCVTIRAHATRRHYLIWIWTVRQTATCWYRGASMLKYALYRWTRQRIHNTLIVVDRYLRLIGDKTIPDSTEPRLGSFYHTFVAGVDLPHQGVVDCFSLTPGCTRQAPGIWGRLIPGQACGNFWWRHRGPVTSQITIILIGLEFDDMNLMVFHMQWNCDYLPWWSIPKFVLWRIRMTTFCRYFQMYFL